MHFSIAYFICAVGIIGGVSAGPLVGIIIAIPFVAFAFWKLYKLDGKKEHCSKCHKVVFKVNTFNVLDPYSITYRGSDANDCAMYKVQKR